MNPDSTTAMLLFHHEHAVRVAQTQRKRQAEQAADAHSRHGLANAIGWRIGIILVAAGERLKGTQGGAATPGEVDPAGTIRIG